MEHTNTQWIIKSPFYVRFRKHYCPKCNISLRTVKVSRIVHPGTESAEGFELHNIGGPNFVGRVKVVWTEFECPQCMQRITIEKMKEIERNKR